MVLKRGRSKISWTICRIPVRPFDYIVKAGQPARPRTVTGEWRNHDAVFGCYSPPRILHLSPRTTRTYRGIQEGIHPSPVVQLNRAVAIAMRDGPEAGLTHIDAVLEHGELANYYLAHSARADMYRRLGRTAEGRSSYEKALALTQQEPERQFLQERIRQLK